MEYYIQGDPTRANEIKAAFEAKGINVLGFGFADKTVVYCSIGGVCVQSLPYNINLMNILYSHPDYQELPLSVKPNFKVGDWVVKKDGETFYGGNYAEQITLIEVDEKGKCIWLSSKTWAREDDIRPWTIADAKDGDVLCTYEDDKPKIVFIYKDGDRVLLYHCFHNMLYSLQPFVTDAQPGCLAPNGNVKPATKEQRDLLFAKMKEACYEWDAEKKELKKIQPHYDIANFHAGMPVLVRDYNNSQWSYVQFSHLIAERNVGEGGFKFNACGIPYIQCIPFNEETKHLLGTTDMCSEEYINW